MTDRLRGRRLQRIRERRLRDNPLCVRCTKAGRVTLATQIDHIVALCNGGLDVDENRQELCSDCHRAKTAEDMGYKVRPRIGEDGWPVDW